MAHYLTKTTLTTQIVDDPGAERLYVRTGSGNVTIAHYGESARVSKPEAEQLARMFIRGYRTGAHHAAVIIIAMDKARDDFLLDPTVDLHEAVLGDAESWSEQDIMYLELPRRVERVLYGQGIKTIGAALKVTRQQATGWQGFGTKSFSELQNTLSRYRNLVP